MNPPLRSQADIDALWEGVRLGEISTIGSDHVPRKAATKDGGIWTASAGFPGIATLLPVLLDEGWHRRGVGLDVLAAATSANVADLYNLAGRGRIAPGYSADFAIVNLDGETLVDPDQLESHSDYTPWAGRKLKGAVTATVLKGRLIAEGGKVLPGIEAGGEYIFRTAGKA